MILVTLIVTALLGILALRLWQRERRLRREAFIRQYVLPQGLFAQLRKQYPDLTLKDCQLVAQGLRQFFLAHLKSDFGYVSMPSQVVDALWHEFILYTRNYDAFCREAFGRFLHHTPAVALAGGQLQSNAGLRRCWWQACREENINPKAPTRLPLLFALDAKLAIPGGYVYAADCSLTRRRQKEGDSAGDGGAVHCGGDFSSASFDGGTGGLNDGPGDGNGHGGPGGHGDGSDGGDGGGGCGGGGD